MNTEKSDFTKKMRKEAYVQKRQRETPNMWNGVLWVSKIWVIRRKRLTTIAFWGCKALNTRLKETFQDGKIGEKRCLRLESNWKITFLETWSHWYFILLLHRGIFEESWLGSIQHKGGRDSNWSLHWDVCCSYIIYWKIEKVLGVVPWF